MLSVGGSNVSGMFDEVVTGCDAAGLAAPAAADELSSERLAELISVSHRVESVLVARRLAAIAILLRRRGGTGGSNHAAVSGYEETCAEVSALMNLSPTSAGYQVHYAEALATRLPRIGALLADGRLDWRGVQLIISRTDLVDEELIGKLDEQLAVRAATWRGWSRQRIINAVDAAVLALDPDAARQRRKTADEDRFIAVSPGADGMAEVYGRVAAAHAAAFDRRLTELADKVCARDPRSSEPAPRGRVGRPDARPGAGLQVRAQRMPGPRRRRTHGRSHPGGGQRRGQRRDHHRRQ